MAWYHDDDRPFFRQPSAGERRGRAAWAAETLRAEGRTLAPVEIEGTRIASTFWGKAWCEHIETYSDFANRLPRGRTYVRSGTVIDLQLTPGKVRALVHGSELYEVAIDLEPLARPKWQAMVKQCSGQIDSVVALLGGQLPDAVMRLLCDREQGLFPGARELSLSCSCPDRAGLCKHLAAVLYGVGARLDKAPELFFVLRGVDQLDLVSEAGSASSGGASDELQGADLAELFGIELQLQRGPGNKRRKAASARRRTRRS